MNKIPNISFVPICLMMAVFMSLIWGCNKEIQGPDIPDFRVGLEGVYRCEMHEYVYDPDSICGEFHDYYQREVVVRRDPFLGDTLILNIEGKDYKSNSLDYPERPGDKFFFGLTSDRSIHWSMSFAHDSIWLDLMNSGNTCPSGRSGSGPKL